MRLRILIRTEVRLKLCRIGREACGLFAAIRREYIYLTSIARTLWLLRLVKPDATRSIVDIVESQARQRPGNIAISLPGPER